jgi:zinc protease
VAAAVLLALLVAVGGGVRAGTFDPEIFTLDNGMQVAVIENPRIPAVTHMVWYRVGSVDEPEGRSGVAHLLEHLMFKGTVRHPAGAFSRAIARHGGEENAFTSHDLTAYFQTIAKDRLEMVMEMEADRMRNLAIDASQVATEAQVVLEERHQRVDNRPAAILGERADATLFLNANYRRPIIGWEHELRRLRLDDAVEFYRRWYAPNNALLVVAGDVTVDEVRPLAQRIYGAIEAQPLPERVQLIEPPPAAERRVVLRDERVRQPAWSRQYLAPSYLAGETQHAEALQVLAEILGGGTVSRLYRGLVVDDARAVSAQAGYDATRRGPSRFGIYVSPRLPGAGEESDAGDAGDGLERIERAVDDILDAVRTDDPAEGGITEDEVEGAKRRLLAQAVFARDSLSAGAYIVGEALAIGLSADHVDNWPERIKAVTRADVTAAAAAVLRPERSVTSLLLPPAGDEAAGLTTADPPAPAKASADGATNGAASEGPANEGPPSEREAP